MKAAILCAAVLTVLCAASARAADDPFHRSGYEVGGAYLGGGGGSLQGPKWSAYTVSLGRWQRLTHSVTWVNRLEYAGLPDITFLDGSLIDGVRWNDVGQSIAVETGLELHPPVAVGLAPYIGLNVGLGVARWGSEHENYYGYVSGGSITNTTTVTHYGTVPALTGGAEIGIRVFAERPWPNLCLTLGGRVLGGPHGAGVAAEPVVSIGY